MWNKKAMLDDAFDFLFTVFAAFFLLMFLGMVFNSGFANSAAITASKVNDVETKSSLMVYLQTKTEVEGKSVSFANLILEAEKQPQAWLEKNLLAKTKENLDATLGAGKWAINICYPPDKSQQNGNCWLYPNMQQWQSTIKGMNGNLRGENKVIIYRPDGKEVQVWMRQLK